MSWIIIVLLVVVVVLCIVATIMGVFMIYLIRAWSRYDDLISGFGERDEGIVEMLKQLQKQLHAQELLDIQSKKNLYDFVEKIIREVGSY